LPRDVDQVEFLDDGDQITTIVSALRVCATEAHSSRTANGLRRTARFLEDGENLAVLRDKRNSIPPELRAIIIAGQQTGQLPKLLTSYISAQRQLSSSKRHVLATVMYPLFALVGASLVLWMLFSQVVLPSKGMFEDFGVLMPALTTFVFEVAEFLSWSWPFFLGIVLLFLLFLIFHREIPGAVLWTKIVKTLPVIGAVTELISATEFCHRLSVLVEARVSIPEALNILGTTLHDPHLAYLSQRLAYRIERGESPIHFSSGVPGMLPALAAVFRWSRDPNMFEEGLKSTAEMFSSQTEVRSGQLGIIFEPLCVLAIACVVGAVLVAVFMPLTKLLYDLS